MARAQKDDSFAGLAALVFFGFFALVIATSAAGRWLANIGPDVVVVKAPAPKAPAPAAAPAAPPAATQTAPPDAPALEVTPAPAPAPPPTTPSP